MSPNNIPSQSATAIRPLGLVGSLLLFGVPALGFSWSVLSVLPSLARQGYSNYTIFVVTFLGPLAVLFLTALAAYRIEGRPWTWASFAERMRLAGMNRQQWLWTIGLVVGSFALQILIAPLARALQGIPLISWPPEFGQFMASMEQGSVGLDLRGRWDVLAVVSIGLALFNVGGEELWWRGIILPRQELAFGKWTWILHGVLWDLFHVFYYTDLGKLVANLAITLPVAFVSQRTRNTWPAIVLHYIINVGFPLIVAKQVIG